MANPIEAIKDAKDGLDVLPDLYRYAAMDQPEFEDGDLERLKWYGSSIARRRRATSCCGCASPTACSRPSSWRRSARYRTPTAAARADITTRQNLQLRWIRIQDAPAILQRLSAAGLTSQQSGMDNVRNVVGCPLAGIDADELMDARPLASRLQQAIIGHRGFSNLPRKFNLSITGCREDCTHAQAHDLSFTPATIATPGGRDRGLQRAGRRGAGRP